MTFLSILDSKYGFALCCLCCSSVSRSGPLFLGCPHTHLSSLQSSEPSVWSRESTQMKQKCWDGCFPNPQLIFLAVTQDRAWQRETSGLSGFRNTAWMKGRAGTLQVPALCCASPATSPRVSLQTCSGLHCPFILLSFFQVLIKVTENVSSVGFYKPNVY